MVNTRRRFSLIRVTCLIQSTSAMPNNTPWRAWLFRISTQEDNHPPSSSSNSKPRCRRWLACKSQLASIMLVATLLDHLLAFNQFLRVLPE